MNYEKKYKEGLERARKLYEQGTITESLCYVFPELAESEDEKVRKSIIAILNNYVDNSNTFKPKMLAWLEKQGEQMPQGKSALEAAKEEKVDNQNCVKPTDNVEPKFKVGNWYQCTKDFFGKGVTFDKDTAYYCAKEGCLQNEYGCHIAIVKDLYDNFKLWTIQDAKDGDVLAAEPIKDYLSSFVAIYKKQNEEDFDSYCFIGFDGKFYEGVNGHSTEEVHPATKEQRDTFKKAMNEAGYEWDAERKELKKTEQESVITIPKFKVGDKVYELRNGFECTIESIDETTYYGDTTNFDIKDQDNWELVEQNPAWGKEDEDIINHLLALCSVLSNCAGAKRYRQLAGCSRDDVVEYQTWLRTIKERVQPQQKEWSEEDETMITDLSVIVHTYFSEISGIPFKYDLSENKIRTWLKSLRPQNIWKPSDEQLNALHDAAVYVDKSMFPYPKGILMKLYKQLKKL